MSMAHAMGEQGVKNQFKVINLLSNPEPLKQLCLVRLIPVVGFDSWQCYITLRERPEECGHAPEGDRNDDVADSAVVLLEVDVQWDLALTH